ncbi:MAG TPA: UPF0280 family protein [Thermotogota bacterium]|nr:UPF0280 family protein [Thermotogota bacterium]HPH11266.1 UPF0280 family protein [Thermotogota bacterium]
MAYEERMYRSRMIAEGLTAFRVVIEETDLMVFANDDYGQYVTERVRFYRDQLKAIRNPLFFSSLVPIEDDPAFPPMVRHMIRAAQACGVGPMAAVAGAISEYVGRDLLKLSNEVIIENGGDIFLRTHKARTIGIYAGDSPLSNRLSLFVLPEETPLGICTSSGTMGHSLSFGKADAVVALSEDTLLADAAATAIANRVRSKDDIESEIETAQKIRGILGLAIIIGKHLGLWGQIRLSRDPNDKV